jgi:DNA-binding beta-propeller fold protein YncE
MDTVKRFCNKAILLNDGKIIAQGDPMLIADEYSRLNMPVENIEKIKKPITNIKIKTYNRLNKETESYKYGEKMIIELSWPRAEKVLNAGVAIYSNDGTCVYATNTFIDHVDVLNNKIMYTVELNLIPAKYFISVGTFLDRPEMKVDFISRGPEFTVIKEKTSLGEGISVLKHEWRQVE